MTPEDWENLCDGCGQCCEIRDSGIACSHLDVTTNRCTSYETRHIAHPPCCAVTPLNVLALFAKKVLPWDCPYVRTMQGRPLVEDRQPAKLLPMQLANNEFQLKFYADVEEFRKKFRPATESTDAAKEG